MPCKIENPANYDLGDLESHIHGMYDHFDQKYGFQKPPVMVFDSDPGNQSKVLGKTAYYDPQSLEIHVFVDGRHPKDVLRSIAHELIHHRQNMEGRLDTGGYSGPGYYLENDELKEVEHEAMLEGNATMREYEDTVKYKEKDKMSLKEWKNNELNRQLLKRFGILKENKKPDFPDVDGDGDREEPISKAQKDKKAKGGDDKKASKPKKGEVPPQLQKHVKGKKDNEDEKEEVNELASHGLEGYPKRDDDKEEIEESTSGRHSDADRRQSKDREYADRLREGEEEENKMEEAMPRSKDTMAPKPKNAKMSDLDPMLTQYSGTTFDDLDKAARYAKKNQPDPYPKNDPTLKIDPETGEKYYSYVEEGKKASLQESIKRIAKARRVFLKGKRIK